MFCLCVWWWCCQREHRISQLEVVSPGPRPPAALASEFKPQTYTYDYVFPPTCNNAELYTTIARPIVDRAMQGFHGLVFAYGQTSAGKTYTMSGSQMVHGMSTTDESAGIMSRSVRDLFAIIEHCLDREFLLRVSYMEVCLKLVCLLRCHPSQNPPLICIYRQPRSHPNVMLI
jgi:hypothetical protein